MLMPKANLKSALLLIITLSYLLSGCSDPAAEKEALLSSARTNFNNGNYTEALAALNEIAATNPDDLTILSLQGSIYQAMGDDAAAAFLFERVHHLDPDDDQQLLIAYHAKKKANQPAAPLLEKYASQYPQKMTASLWRELGQYHSNANRTDSALAAYLKADAKDTTSTEPSDALAIGLLFKKLDNLAQAQKWLATAAESEDPNALAALFGLLELQLQEKDFPAAENTVAKLEQRFPGAIAASEWATSAQELTDWRKDKDAMLAAINPQGSPNNEQTDNQSPSTTETAVEAETETAQNQAPAGDQPTENATLASTSENNDSQTEEPTDTPKKSKTESVEELAAIEAMAFTPATEANSENIETTIDPAQTASESPEGIIAPTEIDSSAELTELEDTPVPQPIAPRTPEQLLEDAAQAEIDRDYARAIQFYWQALSMNTKNAEAWNRLCQAYLIDGQIQNAETAGLESIRLAPNNLNFTLDYLRVAQRAKKPTDFLIELENSMQRFPQSPEIALTLARAYESISANKRSARTYYQRFLQLAPSHPLRSEAEDALSRL